MPPRPRSGSAHLIFHVYNRAIQDLTIFTAPSDYDDFVRLLGEAVRRYAVRLIAYAVMPNHWHLVLWPTTDEGLSRCMQWLSATHARRWRVRRGTTGRGAVYQGRYKAVAVQADTHFLNVCRYVERNPLRARLVARAEDWPWSSASAPTGHVPTLRWVLPAIWTAAVSTARVPADAVRSTPHAPVGPPADPRLPSPPLSLRSSLSPPRPALTNWPVARPPDWQEMLNVPDPPAMTREIREATRKGLPLGDDLWRRSAMRRLHWRIREGRPGRPRSDRQSTDPRCLTPVSRTPTGRFMSMYSGYAGWVMTIATAIPVVDSTPPPGPAVSTSPARSP